jgi:hypothetical protein
MGGEEAGVDAKKIKLEILKLAQSGLAYGYAILIQRQASRCNRSRLANYRHHPYLLCSSSEYES